MGPEPTADDWAAYRQMRHEIRRHRKRTGAGTIRARIRAAIVALHNPTGLPLGLELAACGLVAGAALYAGFLAGAAVAS